MGDTNYSFGKVMGFHIDSPYAFKLSNMFKDNYNKLFRQTNIKDYSIFGPN